MGYIRHHAILVTSWDAVRVHAAHAQAETILEHRALTAIFNQVPEDMLTPVIVAPQNGYCSFAILPDGSKGGWEESDEGDHVRASFIAWMEEQRTEDGGSYLDWVEVIYGDEGGPARVTRSSDPPEITKAGPRRNDGTGR